MLLAAKGMFIGIRNRFPVAYTLAVLAWRHPCLLPEFLNKIAGRAESTLISDLADRPFRMIKERFGALCDSQIIDIAKNCASCMALEVAAAFVGAQIDPF